MKLTNNHFGEIKFEENNILHFKNGLFGFEECKKFLLIKTDDDLFYWLSSIDIPELVFPLIGLRLIDEAYPQAENMEAFGIVTLSSNPQDATVNLKAPVYINQDSKEGYQIIVDRENYSLYYNLFQE